VVTGVAGQFSLVQGLDDAGRFAGGGGVLAGHDAGEAGQLGDQLRAEVELGQVPGPVQGAALLVVEPDQVGELGGNGGDAIGPVVHGAEPVGEGQAGQPLSSWAGATARSARWKNAASS
jgi:hypothetical protein